MLGTGEPGESPEGDLATTLTLIEPVAVAVRPGFDMLVADAGARRIYAIDDAGVVRIFAGTDDVLVPTTGTDVVKPRVLRQMVRRQNGRVVVIAEGAESDALLEYLPDGTNVVELPIVISGPATGGTGQLVDELFQNSRIGATGRPLALLDDRVVVGVGSSLLVEQSDGSFVLHDLELDHPVDAITVEATVDLELLHVVSEGQVFQVASLSPVTLLLQTGAGVGEKDVAIAMHNGVLVAGSLKQGIVSAGQSRISFGDGRSGDGGAPSASSVNAVSALVSEGPGSLLIVDRGARVVRRMTGTFSDGVIETIVGDVHPAGPGTIATGTPYAPRNLALRAPGSLILGGAQGRILELRFGAGQNVGVAVVAGHPSPALSPTPRVARFEGLFADAAAFSAVGQTLTVLNRTSVLTIDTSSEDRAAWTVTSTTAPTAFDGPMFIARHNDQILVSEARRSCVRAFVPGTSTLGSAPPLFGSCGEAGSFSGLLRNPGPLVVANSGAIYLADTGNNRVLRRDPDTGVISVVIGDGSPSSAGQGGPAGTFPVNAPGQLAVDTAGNLFIASSTTVRLVANVDGDTDADADDDVSTIYGLANRDTFPESESRCVAALTLDEQNDRLYIADACVGFVVSLDLVDLP